MRNRLLTLLLALALGLLLLWRRRRVDPFAAGTLAELRGYSDNARKAAEAGDLEVAYALLGEMLHIIQAEQGRRR